MARRITKLPKGQGAAAIYAELKRDIVELRLAPSAPIEESRLHDRFGLSRTPVREALTRLASEGLVELRTNRRSVVTPITIEAAAQYLETLDAIAAGICRLAALRRPEAKLGDIRKAQVAFRKCITVNPGVACTAASRDFHSCVGEASGNRYLQLHHDRLLDNGMRLSNIPFQFVEEGGHDRAKYLRAAADEYDQLIAAIAARDGDRAVASSQAHIQLLKQQLLRFLPLWNGGQKGAENSMSMRGRADPS